MLRATFAKIGLIALLVMLTGCVTAPQAPTGQPSSTPSPTAVAASPTPTLPPTPTPLPGRLLLIAPSGNANAEVESFLTAEAQKAGLDFERRETLQTADLSQDVHIVVLLVQPADLGNLVAAGPQIQFVVISAGNLGPGANLTILHASPEQQAFVAGFTAALLSADWRAGGLISSDQPQIQQAFKNGASFYCGDCAPGWPQKVTFPLLSSVGDAGDGPAWAASAQDQFDNGKAEVFYLSDPAAKDEVYAALAGKVQVARPVKVFGSMAPPAALKGQWAATITINPLEALKKALPEMLAGRSAAEINVPPQLIQVDPALLSPGRQDLINKVIADLVSGLINPASVP